MAQYTHGMPYGALAFTPTAPPFAPLPGGAAGAELDVEEGLAGEELELDADDEPMPLGTEVASDPSSTFTWPAATDELAVAETPENAPAILEALAPAPVPYSTSVDDCFEDVADQARLVAGRSQRLRELGGQPMRVAAVVHVHRRRAGRQLSGRLLGRRRHRRRADAGAG